MGCEVGGVARGAGRGRREEVEGVMSQGWKAELEVWERVGEGGWEGGGEGGVKRESSSERGAGSGSVGVGVWVVAFCRACAERFSFACVLAFAMSSPWLRRLLR